MAKKTVKLPKAYVNERKKESVKTYALPFGDASVDIEIKQTVSPVELSALVDFCIEYATIRSKDEGVYDDRFYEFGFRLGVIGTFTNLNIEDYVDCVDCLTTGEGCLYWFVALRIDSDTFDMVSNACSTRRAEMLKNRENMLSPLGGLLNTVKNAFSMASDYLNTASEHIEKDIDGVVIDAVTNKLSGLQKESTGDNNETS